MIQPPRIAKMSSEELAPFVLKKVKGLDSGEKKGSGAYGAVYEVTVNGITCIAKRIHDVLVTQISRQEKTSVQKKFAAECVLLSKLRHPNVVHFVGVHYGRSDNDLSLIMECLHADLSKFLEDSSREIPLSIKLSILLDVSYGLLYFHTQTPPIIHRDLSANNVLLTTDLRAKIADLGVAKLLDVQTQVAVSQTMAPGSLHYMPPEALKENPVYNLKLDIFSFGHLTLFVAVQKPPNVHELDETTMYNALKKSTIQIQRRRRTIEQIGGERHILYPLITQCLQDKVERRPTTTELNDSLKELCTKHPCSMVEVLKIMAQAGKGEIEEKANCQGCLELKQKLATVQEENTKLAENVDTLHQDKQSLEEALNDANIWGKGLRDLVVKLQTSKWQKEKQEEMLQNDDLPQEEVGEIELKGTVSEQHQTISRLLKEKEELQTAVQIAKTEAQLYKEDFASERSDRENAHDKIADLEKMHAEEVGMLTAKLLQMEELRKRKGKKLFTELESHNKEQLAEKEKLCKELDKTQKELDKAKKDTEKAKAEAEKYKKEAEKLRKDAKRKQLDKLVVSPEPEIVLEEPSQSPRMSPVQSQAINALQEIMKKDEGSKQDQTPCYERSTLQKSPSFPRLSSPNTPDIHPVASVSSGPSLRKQPQAQQVQQSTLQLKFTESPQRAPPKTLSIPKPKPVSSDPLSHGEF